jgi:hypothetical protein
MLNLAEWSTDELRELLWELGGPRPNAKPQLSRLQIAVRHELHSRPNR